MNTDVASEDIRLVKQFACPGCACGMDPMDCEKFDLITEYGAQCKGHSAGTFMSGGVGRIYLGLPKGFNRSGEGKIYIRMWKKGTAPEWDNLNVAVWAMVEDDFLYVRTYSPRTNATYVDVIEGGPIDLCPDAINVGEFLGDID